MSDETMTPTRALTIAINAVMEEDQAAGVEYQWAESSRVHRAAAALDLATRILKHLPSGWVVLDRAVIDELSQRVDESAGATKILLALRIQQDGFAQTFKEAVAIADDKQRVREMYPQIPA